MALEKIRATTTPELVTMDLTVVTMVLALEATAHPTNMALQILETPGVSPVTTALEPTTILPPRQETMGVILALGLGTMVQELAAMALVVMVLRLATLVVILATMDLEVITTPLPRLEVTALDLATTVLGAMVLRLETLVAILAAMAREVTTIPLPRLEATALQALETMEANPAAILATMAPGLETMDLDLATILLTLETTAASLAITGTATAHRLVGDPVTAQIWQTNWIPGWTPTPSVVGNLWSLKGRQHITTVMG